MPDGKMAGDIYHVVLDKNGKVKASCWNKQLNKAELNLLWARRQTSW